MQELTRLKGEFPRDLLVSLIDATLVATEGDVKTADEVLDIAEQDPLFLEACIKLLVDNAEYEAAG